MWRKLLLFVMPALLLSALALAGNPINPKIPIKNVPILTGNEPGPSGPVAYPPYSIPHTTGIDAVLGDTETIGTTWYENQHNGTCGRMNVLEPGGWQQFAWMNGENINAVTRHIWWNGIDPNGIQVFHGNGVAVESSSRGGFVNLDVLDTGASVPAYHDVIGSSTNPAQTALSVDLVIHSGAFVDFQAPATPVPQIIWPRMQISQDQRLHIVSTESPLAGTAGLPSRQYYISATYNPSTFQTTYDPAWTFVDWSQTIAADLATSRTSNKLLVAWTRSRDYLPGGPSNPDSVYSQRNNDLYYLIDPDGLNPDFTQAINLTQFIPPDSTFLPDTVMADRDTLRPYTDISTFIDNNNYAHIAFTTAAYFSLEGTTYFNASMIWHWSEQFPDTFTVIANYWNPQDLVNCGVWNLKAQRPSLGQDSAGVLYCAYQVYDTDSSHLSLAGYPSGEIYVTRSLDGGMNWSQGTDVTNTITPNQAPAGRCLSEVTPTLAKKVDSYLHLEYVLDADAGNILQTEGSWTLNSVKHHRVPVSVIPSTPVVPNLPFHVSSVSAVLPGPNPAAGPYTFALKQNYPNPFNPSTAITFILDQVGTVSLDIYNTKGQVVANILKGTYGPGEHTISFEGTSLASGVYYAKLTSGQRTALQKMVLLK